LVRPRSPKHHRFFFKVIELAYHNWPETHAFQPDSTEHLRAWLLIRAGYRLIIGNMLSVNDWGNISKLADFLAMLTHEIRTHGFAFPVLRDGMIEIQMPKSIKWSELDQKEFAPIAEAVFDEIEIQTGMKIADFKDSKSSP